MCSKGHLPSGLPHHISSGKEGVMTPCFPGKLCWMAESMGIYFRGDYLNLVESQVRVPTERHMGLRTKEWQLYELQRTCTRSLKIWIPRLAHLLTG